MKERKTGGVLSSTFARIVAFFLLAISVITGVGGAFLTLALWESDAYTNGVTPLVREIMKSRVVWDDVNYVKALYQQGDVSGIENYLSGRNVSMEILDIFEKDVEDAVLLWSNYDGADTPYTFNCFTDILVTYEVEPEENVAAEESEGYEVVDEEPIEADMTDITPEPEMVTEYHDILVRVYVGNLFPYEDEYKSIHDLGILLEEWLFVIPVVAVISILICLICFIFLMCSAGHHRGKEGISGGVLYFLHFDIITAVFGSVAMLGFICIVELTSYSGDVFGYALALALTVAETIWCTIYCMEFATELKMGTLFRHTLIWTILRKCGRGVRIIWRGIMSMMRGLPLVTNVMLVYVEFAIVQLVLLAFFCLVWSMDAGVLVLCLLEKVVLAPVVIYFALVCKKLKQGSEALAEGDLSYKLDTSKMIWGFKEHGENLNRIGDGIAVAVDERMKSEHLKTELITNVSHDLKTPLTSIINYADLLGTAVSGKPVAIQPENTDGNMAEENLAMESGEVEIDRVQLAEYSEVLVRQSKRLKKLLEDLVEASKATTGNLEVNLAPCEISVILSQAIGEYEPRFEEKQLDVIVRQPGEPVNIQADGRHLWRVFDNLMNNICKYAQEGTRVYLTVLKNGDTAEIVFRNMSKYPLDISGEELQERFVRGDKSRHMEGNGLGLSIAGSLVELQNGKMEIVTDGDLFKVSLYFPLLSEKE